MDIVVEGSTLPRREKAPSTFGCYVSDSQFRSVGVAVVGRAQPSEGLAESDAIPALRNAAARGIVLLTRFHSCDIELSSSCNDLLPQ
jgi:hypothetical protein